MDSRTLKKIFKEALAQKTAAANYSVENAVRAMVKFQDLPNPLFSDYEQFPTEIWTPRTTYFPGSWTSPLSIDTMFFRYQPAVVPEQLPEADFEVNMVEALVGWRRWIVDLKRKRLTSQLNHDDKGGTDYDAMMWEPDKAARASCYSCSNVPSTHHTCGIHALDSQTETSDYTGVLGSVYGWGRYARGNKGWRSEFAYPKEFYLVDEPPEVIEILKLYHVPIYVQQPLCIYDPTEDGYEYRATEANGDRGTPEVSRAGEEGDEETYY